MFSADLVYVATGNTYAGAAAPSSDAVIALTLSGKIEWVKQLFPMDRLLSAAAAHPARTQTARTRAARIIDFGNSPISGAVAAWSAPPS